METLSGDFALVSVQNDEHKALEHFKAFAQTEFVIANKHEVLLIIQNTDQPQHFRIKVCLEPKSTNKEVEIVSAGKARKLFL